MIRPVTPGKRQKPPEAEPGEGFSHAHGGDCMSQGELVCS